MFRLIITLFAFMLLPFQAVAFYDEDEKSSSSANVPPDFPDDGRYEAYHGDVKPVIPMNTEDPSYDLWKIPREDLSKGRDPGPINVQRYPCGLGFMGIPTFFRLPVALTPDDLRAGDLDVAMLGAYNDMSFGQRGANRGPTALRASMAESVTWGDWSMAHMGISSRKNSASMATSSRSSSPSPVSSNGG